MAVTAEQLAVEVTGSGIGGVSKSLGSLAGSAQNAEVAVAAMGAAIAGASAAGLAKSVSAFASFDEKMQESIAIMGDVSASEREDLEKTARQVAKSTTMSHEQAAESYYYLASAGLDAAQSVKAMPQVAALAEAGAMDMAQATDYATDVMSGFGLEVKDMTRVTDTMTGTVTRHNSTMEGMGEALSYVAPIAKGVGMSIEETSAAIGMMSDAGIKGSRAGTALRGALSRLSNPTKNVKETLDKLGVSVTDSQGNMRNLGTIMDDLKESGASTADIMALFGQRAGPAMQVLLDQGTGAIQNEAKELKSMKGITQDVAKTQKNTLNKQLDILQSNLHDVFVTTGSQLTPALRKLLTPIAGLVSKFGTLNDKTDGMAGTIVLLTGLIGGTIAAVGSLTSVLATSTVATAAMSGAVGALGTAFTVLTGPVGIALAAVAGLYIAWQKNLFGIRDVTNNVIGRVKQLWNEHKATVDRVLKAIQSGVRSATAVLRKVLNGQWGELWNGLKNIVSNAISSIVSYLKTDAKTDARNAFYAIGRGIRTVALEFFTLGGKLGKVVKQFLSSVVSYLKTDAKGDAKNAFYALGSGIRTTVLTFFDVGGKLWTIIGDFISGVVSYLKTDAKGDLKTAGEVSFDALVAAVTAAVDSITPPDGIIAQMIGDIVSYLKNDAWSDLKAAGEVLVGVITAAFEGLYDGLIGHSLIPDMFDDIASYIKHDAAKDLAKAARNAAKAAANALKHAFNNALPNKIKIPGVTVGGGKIAGQKIPSAHIGGQSLKIPHLAKGGIVDSPTVAMIGESGPEAVVPLNKRNNPAGGTTIQKMHVEVYEADNGEQVVDEMYEAINARSS